MSAEVLPRAFAAKHVRGVRPEALAILLFAVISAQYFVAAVSIAAHAPLWMDEVLAIRTARLETPTAIWRALVQGAEFSPPLYDLFLGRLHALGVDSALWWRLPSIGMIYLAAVAVARIAWRQHGLLGAALAAGVLLSSGAFGIAVQARPYATVVAAFALALALRDRPAGAPVGPVRSTILAILLTVLVGLHFYAVLLVGVLVVAELLQARIDRILPSRGVLGAALVATTSLTFWWPILDAAHDYASADVFAPFYYARPTVDALGASYATAVGWLAVPLAAVLVALAVRPGPRVSAPLPAAVLLLLAIPVVVFLFALAISHSFADRYIIAVVLGLALLFPALIVRLGAAGTPLTLLLLATLIPGNRWRSAGEIAKTDRLDVLAVAARAPGTLPIVTGSGLRFIEASENLTPSVARRLVFLDLPQETSPDPTNRNQVIRLKAIDPALRVVDARAFLCRHAQFWLLAQPDGGGADLLPRFLAEQRLNSGLRKPASLTLVRAPHCASSDDD